jgi:ABC-type multidrug transport system ATPase subunit
MWTLRFRGIIAGLRRPGRTMLIASHDLAELSAVADRVIIIDQGKVVRTVDTASVEAPARRDYRLMVAVGADRVPGIFPGAVAIGEAGFEMRQITLDVLNAGLAELLRGGGQVVSVAPSESLLEQQFREAVEVVKK